MKKIWTPAMQRCVKRLSVQRRFHENRSTGTLFIPGIGGYFDLLAVDCGELLQLLPLEANQIPDPPPEPGLPLMLLRLNNTQPDTARHFHTPTHEEEMQ